MLWGFPFISRGAAFSGRPIRQPTRQGAADTHRKSLHFLTNHRAPSTVCSSINGSAARSASLSLGPSSGMAAAASRPACSVSAILFPCCLAAVSAAIRGMDLRCSKSSTRRVSSSMIFIDLTNRFRRSSMCALASILTLGLAPTLDAICNPNPPKVAANRA